MHHIRYTPEHEALVLGVALFCVFFWELILCCCHALCLPMGFFSAIVGQLQPVIDKIANGLESYDAGKLLLAKMTLYTR